MLRSAEVSWVIPPDDVIRAALIAMIFAVVVVPTVVEMGAFRVGQRSE